MTSRTLIAVLAAAAFAITSCSAGGDASACRTVGESLRTAVNAIDAMQHDQSRTNITAADDALADLENTADETTGTATDVQALMRRIKAASTATRASEALLLSGSRIVAASDAWQTTCAPLV